jgi:hypothetical protein
MPIRKKKEQDAPTQQKGVLFYEKIPGLRLARLILNRAAADAVHPLAQPADDCLVYLGHA